jgi:hypothetical protein
VGRADVGRGGVGQAIIDPWRRRWTGHRRSIADPDRSRVDVGDVGGHEGAALRWTVQSDGAARGETSRVLVRRSTPTTSRAAGRPHWDLSLNRKRTARSHRCFPGVPRSEGPGPPSAIKNRRLQRLPVATASRDLDERGRTHRHDVLGSSRIPRRERSRRGHIASRLATGVVPQHEVVPGRFGRACPAAESGPFDRSIR